MSKMSSEKIECHQCQKLVECCQCHHRICQLNVSGMLRMAVVWIHHLFPLSNIEASAQCVNINYHHQCRRRHQNISQCHHRWHRSISSSSSMGTWEHMILLMEPESRGRSQRELLWTSCLWSGLEHTLRRLNLIKLIKSACILWGD